MSLQVRSMLVLIVGVVLGLTISLGGGVLAERSTQEAESLPVEQVRMLAEVLERVRRDYVDVVDDRELIENAIRGMVADLDPILNF